jgi:hypothetical protein
MNIESLLTFIRHTARMESVMFFEVELPQGEADLFKIIREAGEAGLDCNLVPGSTFVRLIKRLDGLRLSENGSAVLSQRSDQMTRAMLL